WSTIDVTIDCGFLDVEEDTLYLIQDSGADDEREDFVGYEAGTFAASSASFTTHGGFKYRCDGGFGSYVLAAQTPVTSPATTRVTDPDGALIYASDSSGRPNLRIRRADDSIWSVLTADLFVYGGGAVSPQPLLLQAWD